jgi:predicted alpha/beta superfamily hydrolase
MKKNLEHGFILTILLAGVLTTAINPGTLAQGQKSHPDEGKYPPVIVPYTELRNFYSEILDREMSIFVKLPVSYYENTDRIYPGWYFTDANRSFPMLANMINVFEVPRPSQPEIVLIGIGYKVEDMIDFFVFRTKDLTQINDPSADEYMGKMISNVAGQEIDVRTGGAELFLDFISKELIPFVETNYRVSTNERCLGGYSFGGLFSLYAMFTKPELFTKYYAGSPSISFGNRELYKNEELFASTHDDLNATLFMTMGGLEDSTYIAEMFHMTDLLRSRAYPALTIETHVFQDEWHQSCGAASLMKAIIILNKE